MRKMNLFLVVLLMGILAFNGTAIAEEVKNPCGFISSKTKGETGEIYYINPREISHIQALYDSTSLEVGNSGRYILGVAMTTGHVILYGTYVSHSGRKTAIDYIINTVLKCNQ
jgi:hypothetical protein